MAGVWKAPGQAPAFNVDTMLLLTDGSVLAQDRGTRHWWKLTPDAAGHYLAGSWRPVRPSRHAPLRFASAVLTDGRVLIVGGELQNGLPATDPTVELYDPVTDQWTDVAPPTGWATLGAAPICVLPPDGKVLLGSVATDQCALFDPATQTWAPTGPKNNANSRNETWVLLPGGSVLAITSTGSPAAARYDNGAWVAAGNVQPALTDSADNLGPALLLTGGQVLALGANGSTSLFDPAVGTWTAGPGLPKDAGIQLVAKAAPACLLPDGSVLSVLGPDGGVPSAGASATVLVSFNRTGMACTRLPTQPSNVDREPADCHLLLLPNWSVLFSNGTPELRVYEPDAISDPAWRPFISDWPTQIGPGATGRLEGTQLCGLSQAHSKGGAGAAIATNYPVIRLRSSDTTSSTWYCRSFGQTPMGVATGAALQVTSFQVPDRVPAGSYKLAVVANGIASEERSITVLPELTPVDRPLTDRELELQYELFWRDLNEVHLLMDYVSGRADKSLSQLVDMPDPDDPKSELDPQVVVQRVSMIRFPPVGSATSRARQASLLLATKDKLNTLADPARGLSVAYTSMFAGVSLMFSPGWFAALKSCWRRNPPAGDDPRHRYAYATEAYPNLKDHAQGFQREFVRLPWYTLVWAVFTAFVYWGVALSAAPKYGFDAREQAGRAGRGRACPHLELSDVHRPHPLRLRASTPVRFTTYAQIRSYPGVRIRAA